MNDLAAALTDSVAADGQTPMTGDLAINGDIKLHEVLAYAQIFEQYVLTGTDTLSQYKPIAKGSDDLPF